MTSLSSAEFEREWTRLNSVNINDAWFQVLRNLYSRLGPAQRTELKRRLGWSEEFCVPVSDQEIFSAGYTQRIREHFKNQNALIAFLSGSQGRSKDYRDDLIQLVGIYHAMVLAGFDADSLLEFVANSAPADKAKTIRAYLGRKDKGLKIFGWYAERQPNGEVWIRR